MTRLRTRTAVGMLLTIGGGFVALGIGPALGRTKEEEPASEQLSADDVEEGTLEFLHTLAREAAQVDQQNISSNNQRCGILLAFTGLTTALAGKDLLPHLPHLAWLDVLQHEFYVFWAAAIAGALAVATGVIALIAVRPWTATILSPKQIFIDYAKANEHEVKFDILNSTVQTQVETRKEISRRLTLGSWATGFAVATLAMTLVAAILNAIL